MRHAQWLLLDVAAVLVFVAIGRSVHADGVTVGGMASTSWPFLAGIAAGWFASVAWRHPARLFPAGTVTWLACVLGGMALRVIAGQGTAAPFVGVALGFLGATMLGWRLVALAAAAYWHRPVTAAATGPTRHRRPW